MLDMGWTEILVIGVIALIVVGPKDLPRMLRSFGQFVGKMRSMARDFQRSMDDAAREADLAEFKDIKDTLNDVRNVQSDAKSAIRQGLSKIDREIEESANLKVEEIDEDAPKPVTVGKVEKIEPAESAKAELPQPAAPPAGDLLDDPEPANTAAPEPRTASGP